MPDEKSNIKIYNKLDYERLLKDMDKTAKLLVKRDLELNRVNAELDEKIYQLKNNENKLKEMNDVLEIRLNARTRELRESLDNLDAQIKERTKKLENSKIALMNILDDFKEQKRITEIEQEKNLAIINNFSDGMLIFNGDNALTIINKKAKEFIGIQEENFIAETSVSLMKNQKFAFLMDKIGPEIKEVFREELPEKGGLTLEVTVSRIYSEGGEKYGKFVILHDITREKKVQSLKSEFVSIAAHQLRTPLSAIKWTLTSLLDGDFGELQEEQKKYLRKTNLSNERMINLVDDLLNLSRIEEGRYIYKTSPISIVGLVEMVLKAVEMKANEKKIKLIFKTDRSMPEISVDEEKIKLVFQNLIENAINYSRSGATVRVGMKNDCQKKEALFIVKDEGIGIPENQRERMFTKFFRAENAIKEETVGSGLGLFINKNIVEAHGGRIWFESEMDKGSTFYLALPYVSKDEQFFGKF